MKRAFTLVELIIIVCILGIIAAVVVPSLANYATDARESTAKDHLRTLRTFIEIYASNNEGTAPGYPGNDKGQTPTAVVFTAQMTSAGSIARVIKFPENPFNGKTAVKIIPNGAGFPAGPSETNTYGWVYQPSTKTIRLNWIGSDSDGVSYFNY